MIEGEEQTMKDTEREQKTSRLGYGITETAKLIGCSPGHIRNLIDRKELPSAKIGRRRIVRDEDLRAFLAQRVAA